MSKPSKAGRAPASSKREVIDFSDVEYTLLDIDPKLKAELESKNLVPRWINAKTYMANGNFHRSGWRAYKFEGADGKSSLDFTFGVSPDGYIIRNDLLLAVKTKESQDKWKAKIRAKTRSMSGRNYAQELRETFNSKGVDATVHDGYDENDDE